MPPGVVALLESQNGDGSWGDLSVPFEGRVLGRVGLSSLAALTFLHHGYSHLSKDAHGDIEIGPTVRKALRFLMERLDASGGIIGAEDTMMEQPLAAFALSEAYGLTGSRLFKEAADKAVDRLQALQCPDGSWGSPGPTRWASKALVSARNSDIPVREDAAEALHRHFVGRPADAAALAFRMHRREPDVHSAARADVERLYEAFVGTDPSTWPDLYFNARALSGYAGRASPRWAEWRKRCDPPGLWAALREPPPTSTRSASVLHAALGSLSLSVLYGYAASSGAP